MGHAARLAPATYRRSDCRRLQQGFRVVPKALPAGLLAQLGQARFEGMYGKRLFRNAVENILETDNKAWCGDAGCAPASGAALTRALEADR